ncbi:hypothetical protein [Undibacterium pigrum]|uniref:Uncharacterized protein n=1 Tax=Undibacterium pigrum TaxID=401470 RepID=A0A318J1U7_9BURK|nr:hypothetical protein [Undibacterium pigrum]PXX41374.1 hypothetical protein DFR42_10725 [Undibacterium pigrum]
MCAYNLSWLSSSVQNQGQNLSLLSALLSALNTLSTNNAGADTTWPKALQTLLSALEQDQKPIALGQADWDALKTEWSGLRTALNNQLPAALQPLGYQLSKLLETEPVPASAPKGVLMYPLLTKQAQAGGAAGLGALTFKTSASANVQANAVIEVMKQQPEWATALGYQPVPEKSFFRLGLLGNLGANAGANAAPVWGSVGVNAGATATAHLDLCFNYPPSDYVGQALLKSLAQLPAPGDLPGMLTACQGDDFAVSSLDVSGTVNLSGNIQASSALVQTVASAGATPSWSPVPLGTPVNIAAGVSAKFAASWALDGHQHLTVIKKDGKPVVKLDRGVSRSTGAAVDISASIGIDGIQAALNPVMSKILPSAEPLISKLGALSDLRGLALTALNQKLGLTADDDWTHTAQALLDIATGGPTSKATLALSNSLKKIVDDYTKAYLTQGAAAVTSAQNLLQTQVSTLLAGIPFDTAALNTGFTAALGEVSQKINGEITALGTRLDGLANSAATQIAQSLGLATADLQQFISDLQTQVGAATARLGNWLKSYDDARERISKAIEKIERNKLALEVAYAYQKKQSTTTLIEVSFLQDTPSAQALYKSLWTGQLDNYAAQIKLCESQASAKEIQSLFGRTQQRQISTGFSLSVFDFINASSTTTVLDSITVNTDRDGKIIVARDAISLSSIVNYQGFVSESSLALNLEMLALKDSSPPFNAEFKGSGDSINKDHLKGFFGLLEKLNAVSSGSGSRISDFLFGGTAGSDAIVTQANINGISTLDLNAWLRLLQTPAAKVMAAVQESCLACLTAAVDTGAEHTGMGGSPASWVAYGLNYSGWSEQKFWSTMVPGAGPKDWIESLFLVPQNGVDAIVPDTQMKSSFRRLWEVRRIAYGAGKAWTAVVAEAALFEQLKNEVPAGTAATANTFDRLSKLSKSISQNFALAFQFDVPDALQPMKVSWRFLGLVLALHKLALPDQDYPFITKVETTAYGDTKARLFV